MSDIIEKWIRKCDECGNIQEDNPPDFKNELTPAYENRKCNKCKSTALDYGTYRFYNKAGKELEDEDSE